MTKVAIDIPEDLYIELLEIQLERKKKKIEPTALNKIAVEYLDKGVKTEKPAK